MSTQLENGEGTTYQTREERREEKGRQDGLLGEACAPEGGSGRKTPSRIIRFQNSAKEIKPFVLQDITTTKQLEKIIVERYPMNTNVIGMRITSNRTGSIYSSHLDGVIPDEIEDIYIWLYLKKHPLC